MYYYDFEARMMMEAGCLMPVEWCSKDYCDPIPHDVLEEARKKYRLYQKQQEEQRLLRRRQLYDNISLFLETPDLYVYDPEGRITSGELYELYRKWCMEEKIPLQPPSAFWLFLKKHAPQYCLVYSGNIQDKDGKRARGFYGIRSKAARETGNG